MSHLGVRGHDRRREISRDRRPVSSIESDRLLQFDVQKSSAFAPCVHTLHVGLAGQPAEGRAIYSRIDDNVERVRGCQGIERVGRESGVFQARVQVHDLRRNQVIGARKHGIGRRRKRGMIRVVETVDRPHLRPARSAVPNLMHFLEDRIDRVGDVGRVRSVRTAMSPRHQKPASLRITKRRNPDLRRVRIEQRMIHLHQYIR